MRSDALYIVIQNCEKIAIDWRIEKSLNKQDGQISTYYEENQRMWDISRFVMIALLNLHSDKMLFFGAYKLLVTHSSRDSSCYSGVYERRIRF